MTKQCDNHECRPDHREGVIWRCKMCNRPFIPVDAIEQAEEQLDVQEVENTTKKD